MKCHLNGKVSALVLSICNAKTCVTNYSVNSSNTQLEMLTDGKFEQHVIIEDFFADHKIKNLQVALTVKVGGMLSL